MGTVVPLEDSFGSLFKSWATHWHSHPHSANCSTMATHVCLRMWFLFVAVHHHLVSTTLADDRSDNYIIYMDLSAMPKPFSNQHTWYLSILSSAFTTNNDPNSRTSKHIYTYNNVMNGFSARLSPLELEALKLSPGYISSTKDLHVKPDTTYSPRFLGLTPLAGAWPASKYGKDVIIGVVDTGVWPESRSFKDHGMTNIPSRWKGRCENSIQFNSSLCNKKLIGAVFFNRGLMAKHGNISIKMNSTRDTDGHGTHTSATAAGNRVDGASYFGYATGTASGIAPRARVAIYKAIWDEGAYSSDIIAAIDTAIEDGVDVISLSFGMGDQPLHKDPVAIATFAAMEKGIFVSTSAGNQGPYLETLHNGIPWVITVAASTMDREFHATLRLGNGIPITGVSLYPGNFTAADIPIVFMGLCEDWKEVLKAKNKIVVCEDKNETLGDQVANIERAEAVAAVFISNTRDLIQNKVASMIIDTRKGEIVKGYAESNPGGGAKAGMCCKGTVVGTRAAARVDGYSSRGPSSSCPAVLKPDIAAPGTSILAAWPPDVAVTDLTWGSRQLFNEFNLASGTSMACPHVSGVAALVKGAHPDWSPAAIRSAIMTTSYYESGAASPLSVGAGHINPNKALHPGLVYDVGPQHYVSLLCALNIAPNYIKAVTRSSFNNCSLPSLDLNYPSFIAYFNAYHSDARPKTTTQDFRRTVTNVGEGPAIYIATVTQIEGFTLSVIPDKLKFKEKNQKLSYRLRIQGPGTVNKIVDFGYLTWTDLKRVHVVRSPIVVTSLVLDDLL